MRIPWGRVVVALLAVVLFASWMVRAGRPPERALRGGQSAIEIPAPTAGGATRGTLRLAYVDQLLSDRGTPVLLLHGSPGDGRDFTGVVPGLEHGRRVIVPDLPGFGASSRDVPDYSIRAHARAAIALLEALEIERVHVVGFSMGSGVAIELAGLAPERVASVTLVAGIGVVEHELLGEHHVNRALHGLQLAGLWTLREFVPHFGALDDAFIGVPYARSFYDTDQRPLRSLLGAIDAPALIVHGREDFLVPLEAAREHHRLLPQSELVLFDDGHFAVFTDGARVSAPIDAFLERVDRGEGMTRGQAPPARRAAAAEPFDRSSIAEARGVALLVLAVLLVLATLVSEDLACVAGGLLVASGRMGFVEATGACLFGIVVGDVALFLAGRALGRAALARAPLKWFVSASSVERAGAWFERRGLAIIFASRFMPGMRLPTYVAAGMVRTPLARFTLYFAIAAVLWTPILVGISALLGETAMALFERFRGAALFVVPLVLVALFVVTHVLVPAMTRRGRRRLYGTWLRWRQWEFWPPWLAYPPLIAAILWFGVRYRGPTVFTASNPAIDAGGVIGERKHLILGALAEGAPGRVAAFTLVRAADEPGARWAAVAAWREEQGVTGPLVMKPDAGQRGAGVVFVESDDELRERVLAAMVDTIVQARVDGPEFGVFYVRDPREAHGRIFSITTKVLPFVEGDGRRTLEELIVDDRRAVALAEMYLERLGARAADVPAPGERVRLVDVGTHCRGAVFLDGRRLVTPALEAEIDRIARGYEGFYFGRFDIRAPSVDAFQRGEGLKVIELNGVTSEATHVYDPAVGMREAYRTLVEQWRLAFEIGAENRRRGTRTVGAWALLGRVIRYREEWAHQSR